MTQQKDKMDFADTEIVDSLPSTTVHAIELQERAQIDMQIATAKKYPRDITKVKQKMLTMATNDVDTASSCFFSLPRGGKDIKGPSIRLAEIAIYSFQNIKVAARIIENDGKTLTAQGMCHDLENNVCLSKEVKRKITDKYNKQFSEDMQIVAGNAACSIALRNAIFSVIPRTLIDPVYNAARQVAIGDAKTLKSRVQMAIEKFAQMEVTEAQVLEYLGKTGIDAIDLMDLDNLIGIFNGIRDGHSSIDEAFPKPKSKKPIYDDKGNLPKEDPKDV